MCSHLGENEGKDERRWVRDGGKANKESRRDLKAFRASMLDGLLFAVSSFYGLLSLSLCGCVNFTDPYLAI